MKITNMAPTVRFIEAISICTTHTIFFFFEEILMKDWPNTIVRYWTYFPCLALVMTESCISPLGEHVLMWALLEGVDTSRTTRGQAASARIKIHHEAVHKNNCFRCSGRVTKKGATGDPPPQKKKKWEKNAAARPATILATHWNQTIFYGQPEKNGFDLRVLLVPSTDKDPAGLVLFYEQLCVSVLVDMNTFNTDLSSWYLHSIEVGLIPWLSIWVSVKHLSLIQWTQGLLNGHMALRFQTQ